VAVVFTKPSLFNIPGEPEKLSDYVKIQERVVLSIESIVPIMPIYSTDSKSVALSIDIVVSITLFICKRLFWMVLTQI
jgi:hypothetical protein